MTITEKIEGKSLFRIGATIVIIIGAVLPWLKIKPNQMEVPAVYILGMDTGTEVGGFIFLPLTALAAIASLRFPHGQKTNALALVTGAVVVYISGDYILTYSGYLSSAVHLDSFTPTLGVYLTLIGGAALLIEAGIALLGKAIPVSRLSNPLAS